MSQISSQFIAAATSALNLGGQKITSLANGTNPGDAVNFSQLTSLVTGLSWLNSVNDPDLVNDALSTPPGSPIYSLTYIIGSSPTGAWTGLAGHAVWWDGTSWRDISTNAQATSGQGTAVQVGDRFAVAISTPELFTFTVTAANATAGAIYTNGGYSFIVQSTITGGTTLLATSTGFPSGNSGTLTKSSGTGDSTISFTAHTEQIGGGLIGKHNNIVTVTSNTPGSFAYSFTAPTNALAFSVSAAGSQHFGSSFTYSTTSNSWIDFSGPAKVIAGTALSYSGNTLNVLFDGSTITLSSNQLAIATNGVTNTQMAQMAAHTYKGNNTGSTANAIDVTSTQLTADLNVFTTSLQGLVPSSGGGTVNFLRADGTWAAPTAQTAQSYADVATTTNLNLANNASTFSPIDGVTLAIGQQILVKNQTTTSQNGLYTISSLSSPIARLTDWSTSSNFTVGRSIVVVNGTQQAGTVWSLTATVATVGTTAVTFAQNGFTPGRLNVNIVPYTATTLTLGANGTSFNQLYCAQWNHNNDMSINPTGGNLTIGGTSALILGGLRIQGFTFLQPGNNNVNSVGTQSLQFSSILATNLMSNSVNGQGAKFSSINLSAMSMPTPTGTPTGAPSTSGGTIPASTTNQVKVVALDVNGNVTAAGTASANVVTTGTTSSIVWTWTKVPGAFTYQIWFTNNGTFANYFTDSARPEAFFTGLNEGGSNRSWTQTLPAASNTVGTIPTYATPGNIITPAIQSLSSFYNTGTASQSTTTITGSGTTFTAAMVGMSFEFANGTSAGIITAFNSTTSLTVSTSQTVTSNLYAIRQQIFASPGLPYPTGALTGTGSGTGGTIAAGTYYARIVAVDINGNQALPGVEAAPVTTTGSVSSIAWAWTVVPTAASYQIWVGTTSGGENSFFTSTTNSFTQTATSGTAGTIPSVNLATSAFNNGLIVSGFLTSQTLALTATTTATAAGTTTLTATSNTNQQFTGTSTQTVVLPNATTLVNGTTYNVLNRSTGAVTVNANGGGNLATVAANSQITFTLISNGTSAGTWDVYGVPTTGANQTLSNLSGPTTINQNLNFNTASGAQTTWTILPTTNTSNTTGDALTISSGLGTRNSGNLILSTPNQTVSLAGNPSGSVTLKSGDSNHGATGNVTIQSGDFSSSNTNNSTGTVTVRSGNVNDSSNPSGAMTLATGNNAQAGGSGNLLIMTGTITGGTRGKIQIQDGTQGTAGQFLASTDTSGSLNWTSVLQATIIKSSAAQTTLTGTAGTAICSMPFQGSSHKKVVIYLNAYTDTGVQTYTFPTAFTFTPYVYGVGAGVSGASATTTSVTFTTTLISGFVFIEGY